MISKYSLYLAFILLCHIHNVFPETTTSAAYVSNTLSLDEAFLIVQNTKYSHDIALFGNKVVCENCDLEEIIRVQPNDNASVVVNTKYAYSLEFRSWTSNESLSCKIETYKFVEHGTYFIDIEEFKQDACTYSIKQIGNPSHYWVPVIVGILFIVLYTILVQIKDNKYYEWCFAHFPRMGRNSRQKLIDESINEAFGDGRNNNRIETPNSLATVKDYTHVKKLPSKRLRALDTFRGFSLMVMIFVNYGGGGYWFFDHSIWNGLTIADLVFPWFTWMMGVSIVLSQRSLRLKNVSKRKILLKICRRTVILFVLGFSGQDNITTLTNLRIFGVLQRLAMCYFFTAVITLIFDKKDNQRNSVDLSIADNTNQPLRIELFNSTLRFWMQWCLVLAITASWVLITFLLPVPHCPTGYLGPGGKHDHAKYSNCTGGAAGYIDRVVLGNSHLYPEPTCKEIYQTTVPYDPEGILGILSGILLCYLGVQAGHFFIHSTRVYRTCIYWTVSGIICGTIGLILSHGAHSNSWIPINKNLWSLTFVLILSSLAFFNLTILYLLIDVKQWFTGAPFLWPGMNSIVIYICHDRFAVSFPVQFQVNNTHAEQLAMHLFGSIFWSLVAGFMYYKKVFIAI